MKYAIVIGFVLFAACGKSGEERAREQLAKQAAQEAADQPAPTPAPVTKTAEPAPPAAKPAPPPEPEPTTPAEIDRARNQAMIDGRDKDVLKYCAMGKLDDKSNPQALLGCALAACRIKDADTARRYAKPLPKALKAQAVKVCTADQVVL